MTSARSPGPGRLAAGDSNWKLETMASFYLIQNYHSPVDWNLDLNREMKYSPVDVLRGYFTLQKKPEKPVEFTLKGRKRLDAIFSSIYLFISERTRSLLESEKFTGWDTYPIKINSKRPITEPYYGFCITGQAKGFSSRLLSQLDLFGFDEKTWDGSDFFVVEGNGSWIVTQRVFNAFKANEIEGMFLGPFDPKGTLMDFQALFEEYKRTHGLR